MQSREPFSQLKRRASGAGRPGRLLKLLISMACFPAVFGCRAALRALGRNPGPLHIILYYHSVPARHRQLFHRQLELIRRLAIPRAAESAQPLLPGKRYCSLTFDDGFEDILDNALPRMRELGMPATVFITAGRMGRAARWWPASMPEHDAKLAGARAWRELRGQPVTLGSHTLTHPLLSTLPGAEAKREIRASRLLLESVLQQKITSFSFPYGDCNGSLIALCRSAGYEHIYSSAPANAARHGKGLVTGRIGAAPTDWNIELRLKLLGCYCWLPYVAAWKRSALAALGFFKRVFCHAASESRVPSTGMDTSGSCLPASCSAAKK